MNAIIHVTDMPMVESELSSSDPEKRLSCEQLTLTPYLCGASSLMTADSKELTAPSFATNRRIAARNLYIKRMQLLTASGLIAGITPTSVRKQSVQRTLDIALSQPVGSDAE